MIGTDAAQQSGIDYGFVGGRLPKINPVSTIAAGSLVTEVGNTWTKKGFQPFGHVPPDQDDGPRQGGPERHPEEAAASPTVRRTSRR